MALNNIYTGRIQGGSVLIGNTNVLTSATAPNDTGSYVYTTTIPTSQVPGYPFGTTSTQSQNASTAILSYPAGSTVVFAYLTWVVAYPTGSTSITFVTPKNTYSINQTTSQTAGTNTWSARDVTSIIASDGAGVYTAANLPGTVAGGLSEGVVGWTLIVVYTNSALPTRYINLNAGIVGYPPTTFNFTNIDTPSTGAIKAYYLYSGLHGQYADLTKVQVGPVGGPYSLIGNTSNPWNGASPYNRQVSLFAGNICNADPQSANIGLLDTTGSFGTYNINPYGTTPPTIPPAARVLYDLTAIDISAFMTNSQNTLSVQISGGTGGQSTTQGVQIDINAPALSLTKAVNKTTAYTGDTLTYTAIIQNNGSLEADNVVFLDTVPSGVSFVANSFALNGVTIPSVTANPITYSLATIPINGINTITFQVTVTTIPTVSSTTIPNVFQTTYSYTPVVGQTYNGLTNSNTVNTLVLPLYNNLSQLTKTVDKSYASVGDVLNYTVTIPNTGNATANNVIFYDTIPSYTTFNSSSLYVNGVPNGGNPQAGINIGNILSGNVITVTFQVTVNGTIPNPNKVTNNAIVNYQSVLGTTLANISNTVVTTINSAILSSSKQVNKNYANVGDVLTYTIPIINLGNTTANNVVIIDTIPNNTTLIAGSFKQDGSLVSGSPNPPGVTLPNGIAGGKVSTITFQVTINTIPNPNPILNSAASTYNYTVNPSLPNGHSGSTDTNTVSTQVNNASLARITKYVDKSFATCGDPINYTIVIPNSGNTSALNVILKDTIPNGTVLIGNSVYVNGIQQIGANPAIGVTIPNIGPGATATLTFSVHIQC